MLNLKRFGVILVVSVFSFVSCDLPEDFATLPISIQTDLLEILLSKKVLDTELAL